MNYSQVAQIVKGTIKKKATSKVTLYEALTSPQYRRASWNAIGLFLEN